MKYEIKCKNCGASIPLNDENPSKFCPYCGASVKIDETKYDFKRFKLKHEEEVRRRKVLEKKDDDRKSFKYIILILLAYVIISGIMIISLRIMK